MSLWLEILVSLFLLLGSGFVLVGAIGLHRLWDFFTRLHGPTKATTLGVGCLLVGSSLFFSLTTDSLSLHEILVTLFLFITAPVSAHLLAKAALHRKLPSVTRLPDEPNDSERQP